MRPWLRYSAPSVAGIEQSGSGTWSWTMRKSPGGVPPEHPEASTARTLRAAHPATVVSLVIGDIGLQWWFETVEAGGVRSGADNNLSESFWLRPELSASD